MSGIDFVSLFHTPPSLYISLAETQEQWDEVTVVLSSLEVESRLPLGLSSGFEFEWSQDPSQFGPWL